MLVWKVCEDCLRKEEEVKRAKTNDLSTNDFFSYLLTFFPTLSKVPEHWYTVLEAMLKRGWSVKNIRNTITYCDQIEKKLSEDNWSQLVYVYYNEAVTWVNKLREQQNQNGKVDLTSKKVIVPFKSTSYRDMPNYKMEDL